MGLYYNDANDGNTLSEVCSLEPTIDMLAHAYDNSKSMLMAVITMLQFNETGTIVEKEMLDAVARVGEAYDNFKRAHRAYVERLTRECLTAAIVELFEEAELYLDMKTFTIDAAMTNIRLINGGITKLEQSIFPVDKSCNKSLMVQNVIKVEFPAHGIPKTSHNSTIKYPKSFEDACNESPCNESVLRWAMFRNKNNNKPTTEVSVVSA